MAFDSLLAAVLLALVVNEAWTGALSTHRQGPHWAQATAYGLAAVLLAVRRTRPLQCAVAGACVLAVEFAIFGSPEGFGVFLIPIVAAYTVADQEDRGRALCGLAAVLTLGAAWLA